MNKCVYVIRIQGSQWKKGHANMYWSQWGDPMRIDWN